MSRTDHIAAVSLDTQAAATYLNVSPSGLNRWRKHGDGPAYMRLGKRAVRYRRCDLDAFLAACITNSRAG